ncbi:Prefoldin [Paraphysoderma sedebokerense]|nr:Prefoldin [Paraphysoderma sedebokerense]
MSNKAAASSSSSAQQPSEQEIVMQFNNMKSELNNLSSKLQELDMEKDEHVLVIDSIKDLPPSRKCFRLVGGVLMERTVKDVVPALQTNLDGIMSVIKQLAEQFQKKEKELTEFQKKYNIRIVPKSEVM